MNRIRLFRRIDLTEIDVHNIQPFTFRGKHFKCRVSRIIDGDTFEGVFKWNKEIIKYSIRLARIDCPEIRSKFKKEKEEGLKAKIFLENLLRDEIVDLYCKEFDKYGRILGEIYLNKKCINDEMVEQNHAVYITPRKKSSRIFKEGIEGTEV